MGQSVTPKEKMKMETKFNFKSQVCTDKVQSERLLALGLKKETADMCWVNLAIFDFEEDMWCLDFGELPYKETIPAWSLHRLMCLVFNSGNSFVELSEEDDAYEKLISFIEWRIEKGYLNKEYLV